MFSKVIIIDFAISFIPIPGGAVAAELSFKSIYSSYFTSGALFWAILIWRVIVYYAYIIQGFVFIVLDYIKLSIKQRKNNLLRKEEFNKE